MCLPTTVKEKVLCWYQLPLALECSRSWPQVYHFEVGLLYPIGLHSYVWFGQRHALPLHTLPSGKGASRQPTTICVG